MVYAGGNNPFAVKTPPSHGIGSGEMPSNPWSVEIYNAYNTPPFNP